MLEQSPHGDHTSSGSLGSNKKRPNIVPPCPSHLLELMTEEYPHRAPKRSRPEKSSTTPSSLKSSGRSAGEESALLGKIPDMLLGVDGNYSPTFVNIGRGRGNVLLQSEHDQRRRDTVRPSFFG